MPPFFQEPPTLGDQWRADPALREHLERVLPPDVFARAEPGLAAAGIAAAGPWLALARRAEDHPPRHVPYDAWGRRVDRIETDAAWDALHAEQARLGLAALPSLGELDLGDPGLGEHARVVQLGLIHLFGPSSATTTCPIAMTDAAARVLVTSADDATRQRVLPRLLDRTAAAWTSGQWMTEREGGSDVGRTATTATLGTDGRWRLTGTKWFTSATTADCALALARVLAADGTTVEGSRGLSLFLVERVDPVDGRLQIGDTIRVNRLKDKLGTKSVPTAELTLDGATATLVGPLGAGVRTVATMLNVTRAHNAMGAAGGMRRAVALATAYARARTALGSALVDLPLHRETLADLQVEAEAALALTLRTVQLLGRDEVGTATGAEQAALRGLLPVAKLLTGKDAVAAASEAMEAVGGAGYIEDTGLPVLLRNAQVLPIWEGTTNVLSLDLLRAAEKSDAVRAVLAEVGRALEGTDAPALADAVRRVAAERDALAAWAAGWATADADTLQSGARVFALRLGRCTAAALLVEHAAHRIAKHADPAAAQVADRHTRRWLPGAGAGALVPTVAAVASAAIVARAG